MAALTTYRLNKTVAGASSRYRVGKVGAAVTIYKGAALCRNLTGYLVPAANTVGFKIVGIAQEDVDNSAGAAGDEEVKYLTGVSVRFKNDGTNAVAQANLYGHVWIQDDQTVRGSPGNGVVAGIAESIESDGEVTVYVDPIAAGFELESFGEETVVTATALSLYTRTSRLEPVGTMAMTLGSGRYVGQRKTIRQTGGSATPVSNVAGAFVTDGVATTSAAFNASADQLELEWNGTAWQVLANTSVTLT
jgi:hypothetical protein